MYNFGSRLKAIREQRGLTQLELAKRISKSVSAISSYECNNQMPPGDVLKSLGYVLKVSVDYLLGIDQNHSYSTRDLSLEQQEIMRLLFRDFTTPTGDNGDFSPEQIVIAQKLFAYFSSSTKSNSN